MKRLISILLLSSIIATASLGCSKPEKKDKNVESVYWSIKHASVDRDEFVVIKNGKCTDITVAETAEYRIIGNTLFAENGFAKTWSPDIEYTPATWKCN